MPGVEPVPGVGARVTVCIPTYARVTWLGAALESVIAQTYRDFVLVVGDGGTPGRAVRDVTARYEDPRIRYVRFERNIGILGNFRRTLELARTEYVIQVGDDDEMAPELLEASVAALDAHPRA